MNNKKLFKPKTYFVNFKIFWALFFAAALSFTAVFASVHTEEDTTILGRNYSLTESFDSINHSLNNVFVSQSLSKQDNSYC